VDSADAGPQDALVDVRDHVAAHRGSRKPFEELRRVIMQLGPVSERYSKSQVAYRRRRTFALVWAPGQYLGERGAPLVLSLRLPEGDPDPRWKEVVEPRRGVFTHHLELRDTADIDDQVEAWLSNAYAVAQQSASGLDWFGAARQQRPPVPHGRAGPRQEQPLLRREVLEGRTGARRPARW
jgi:hypothetical protein